MQELGYQNGHRPPRQRRRHMGLFLCGAFGVVALAAAALIPKFGAIPKGSARQRATPAVLPKKQAIRLQEGLKADEIVVRRTAPKRRTRKVTRAADHIAPKRATAHSALARHQSAPRPLEHEHPRSERLLGM